ncbi:MAG: S8 family serine peptidase [Bacteroidetes bacterium]|nr:S8 family serine peptidase [Bacteroidota bacterium]
MRPLITIIVLCLFGSLQAQNINTAVLSQNLLDKIETDPQGAHDFYILLKDQVEIREMALRFNELKSPVSERAPQVLEALQQKARETQGPLLEFLNNHPATKTGSVNEYWITNVIYATGTAELIAELSLREDVGYIDLDGPVELVSVEESCEFLPVSPDGVEPGLEAINSRFMWDMGYTGYGRIGFISDTGVDPDHPSLRDNYRGVYAPNDESFFNDQYPFDCDDHGTHVAGTVVGLDRVERDTIGVAYNSHWIGGATICGIQGQGTVSAFQWALNPDGNIGTTEDMPDVINNSWRNPNVDFCMNEYVSVLNALDAAGVAVVFSAGNEGPGDMTITRPHNINTDIVNTFTVGALNGSTTTFPIADFSSRGPSICGGTGSLLIKPEVSAPGVSVRSCVPDGGYGLKSGTSMAAPHTSGAILLLKEAFPDAAGNDIKRALYFTCTDLGAPGEDNDYGMGMINLEEAFYYLIDQGFTPVDPIVEHDAVIVDMEQNDIYCEGLPLAPIVTVENGGTNSLTSFVVEYYCDNGPVFEYEWEGLLMPGERVTVELPGETASLGAEWVYAEVKSPNGLEEEKPLNNKLRRRVQVLDKLALFNTTLETENGSFCMGAPAFLRVEADGPGTPVFDWYAEPVGGTSLFTGDVFQTPPLNGPQTYYVDAEFNNQVGPGLGIGELELMTQEVDEQGILFDAELPFTINSVLVNAPQTGPRIIELRDADENLLSTRFVQITETGESRIDLNINVPTGTGHRLVIGVGLPLSHHNTGADYPYEIEGFVKIRRSFGQFGLTSQGYYFFYDWDISIPEPCGRTEIVVEPIGDGLAPGASFNPNATEVDLGTSISFTNETANADEYLWVFGDGSMSLEESPNHLFQEPGVYTVSLSASNADGCTDVAFAEITVSEPFSSVSGFEIAGLSCQVSPNPAGEYLRLEFEKPLTSAIAYRMYDASGRTVVAGFLQDQINTLSTQSLPNGIYFLELTSDESRQLQKVVIQH